MDQFRSDHEGMWQKLSQVAVMGAEYDSRERQPHPKCLEGTRVNLLNYIYGILDDREKSRLIWLHGTAGVGKSAVAFTVAERMRHLKMTEETTVEMRLGGTFFFSRKHTKRCTTGYFFATLAYQLATNFPSVRKDVNKAILENPALLDPDKSIRDQMEALFLRPLRKLQSRLRECPPLSFVVDALDECTSESELADLISVLSQALRQPDIPVTHILLTSRSESHISKAIQKDEVRPLVCEIPVQTSGEGVAAIISLDGVDVDNDIYIFLQHSFTELQHRHSNFPQPTKDQFERLASRAGRRFIVASTMMKFIDDGYNDPRTRLQLMLELTSELLPGTEVYKLYDLILSTCADPERAYLHLSIIAALADPLPISQISELLGPGQGRDLETVLVQLRSVANIPTDITLPVTIYHLSVRDYVSDPSNCSLPEVQHITPAHSLLAHASLCLVMQGVPESTALLDALSHFKRESRAMQSWSMQHHQSKDLRRSLGFIVQPLEAFQILITLLWLRGDRDSNLQPWLSTLDGHAWLQTQEGKHWLRTQGGEDWKNTEGGRDWLRKLSLPATNSTRLEPLSTQDRPVMIPNEREWLHAQGGPEWLQSPGAEQWLQTQGGPEWLQSSSARQWLQTKDGRAWLQMQHGRWLLTQGGSEWLLTPYGSEWLLTKGGREWLQTQGGAKWLLTSNGRMWLQDSSAHQWLKTPTGQQWLQTPTGQRWLQTQGGRKWLQTQDGREWLQTQDGGKWLQTQDGREWLQTHGREWLQTRNGREWLQTQSAREWLLTQGGGEWLLTQGGEEWLLTPHGVERLQAQGGPEWLQVPSGREWLQTQSGREWLQTQSGRGWLQTPHGQAWQSTPAASVWVTMGEFSSTSEAVTRFKIIRKLRSQPAFQVIQQFKTLPDFLMFPVFLAFRHFPDYSLQDCFPSDMETIHAMKAFSSFAGGARVRSLSASDVLKYACQNWAFHLSRVANPWDDILNHIFTSFWNHHLLSWLERQWCLKGLRSCLVVLSEGQKLAKKHRRTTDTPAKSLNLLLLIYRLVFRR